MHARVNISYEYLPISIHEDVLGLLVSGWHVLRNRDTEREHRANRIQIRLFAI